MKLSKSLMFVFLLISWNVEAAVVTWTIDDILINQVSGTTPFLSAVVSGSFDYDATADVYSNINVTSIATYGAFTNGDASYLDTSGVYPGYLSILNFNFDNPLTDAGGIINTSVEENLINVSSFDPNLLSGSGSITGTPAVPVPAAVWLFGSGLIGLIGVARRKRA